jgi:hypothetical protein
LDEEIHFQINLFDATNIPASGSNAQPQQSKADQAGQDTQPERETALLSNSVYEASPVFPFPVRFEFSREFLRLNQEIRIPEKAGVLHKMLPSQPAHFRRADDILRASFSARLALAIACAAGIPFTLPDSMSFTRRWISSDHADSISLLVKSSTLSIIFSAMRIRDRGGKSITCFSKARTVMLQIKQKKRRCANQSCGKPKQQRPQPAVTGARVKLLLKRAVCERGVTSG